MSRIVEFLKTILPKANSVALKMFDEAQLMNKSWFYVNEQTDKAKVVFIFNKDGELLKIKNGVVEKGSWNSIVHATNSVILSFENSSILYNIVYLSTEFLVLQQDGTVNHLLFVVQEKYTTSSDNTHKTDPVIGVLNALKDELNSRNTSIKSPPEKPPQNLENKPEELVLKDTRNSDNETLKFTFTSEYNSSDWTLRKENNKWGYVDPELNVVIDFQFEDAYPFSEGLACISKNGKRGYINTKGEIIIDCQFETASYFNNGVATVSTSERTFQVNSEGKEII
ncbi:WG repeat-containing protein [bacterium]|nr:WG repeat-containing protein [bacterium]